ncbi:MAG: SBBP repeat-containing protein [candidate division Zixibacteria bacterium]|nr:SBBP repeat-containing protein [candidate division Zixibacteria bacterium]
MQRILGGLCRQERVPNGVLKSKPRGFRPTKLPTLTLYVITAVLLALTSTALATPTVRFSTFLGGNAVDNITAVVIDRGGHIYVTGHTVSNNFPIEHALQDTRAAEDDIFIAKLCSTGDTLEFCTYFGGNGNDQATGIAIDSAGRVWVCGWTTSTDLRTVMPLQAQNAGYEDALIVCMSGAGDSLLFSSYLGGNGQDRASDLVVDNYGSVGVVGSTSSSNFPMVKALIDTLAGTASDAFVCKINTTSKSLSYSTYFGGSGADNAVGIVIDTEGAIYISGTTSSPDLPVVQPLQDTLMGGFDLFVAKIDSSGAPLIRSTYWGGIQNDVPRGMALASDGKVIIAGRTHSADYPLHLPLQDSCHSCASQYEGFVTAFDKMSGAVQFSTYLGGALGDDEASAVVADKNGKIIVVGWTSASDFPTTKPLQSETSGLREAFVSIISSNGDSSEFSTFYGGGGDDEAQAVAMVNGMIIVAGKTGSSDFPLQNPWLHQYAGGSSDGFVARLDYDDDPSLCGDYDGSGSVDVADIVHLIQFIFAYGSPLLDGRGGDVDCDGGPSIADAVYMISYIFTHGAPPCALCK